MRLICLTATLFVAVALPQYVPRKVFSSHLRIDGSFRGEYCVSDLKVFEDGQVIYEEQGTKCMVSKAVHSTHRATLSSEKMRRLEKLLETQDIRSLPRKISSKFGPTEFFWQRSVEIDRPDKTQEIEIENFHPFFDAYPKAFIALECQLLDIEIEVTKRPRLKDEGNWCKQLREGKWETPVAPTSRMPKVTAW